MPQPLPTGFTQQPDGSFKFEAKGYGAYSQVLNVKNIVAHIPSDPENWQHAQEIVVVDTVETPDAPSERLLILDAVIQTAPDHIKYDEPMGLAPVMAYCARNLTISNLRVLVVGGGDGPVARSILRHPEVAHVDLVDIDCRVSQTVQTFMPEVCGDVFSNPHLSTHYEDGIAYVDKYRALVEADEMPAYDIIVVDSSDPDESVNESLFSDKFYQDCAAILTTTGILTRQNGNPDLQAAIVDDSYRALRKIFPHIELSHTTVPSYPAGEMIVMWSTKISYKNLTAVELNCPANQAAFANCQYLTPEYMQASFCHNKTLAQKLARLEAEFTQRRSIRQSPRLPSRNSLFDSSTPSTPTGSNQQVSVLIESLPTTPRISR